MVKYPKIKLDLSFAAVCGAWDESIGGEICTKF